MNATTEQLDSTLPPRRPGGAALGALHDVHDEPGDRDDDDSAEGAHGEAPADDADAAAAGPWPAQRRARSSAADDAQLAQWLAQIVERDERALAALYDHTLSRVYGLVLRIVRQPACAEEVVEETYFQVWRQAPRFDPARGRALSWLLAVARSRAIDALRHEARFAHDLLDGDDGPATPADGADCAADLIDGGRGRALLQRALLELGAQPRQLVALAFFRGLSHEEIAAQTALPLGTVKSQIRRSLITLREALGRSGLQAWAR
ncbi:MAG: sigma-70 family RNA polymerase sigma factor [Burkholderiaceae bacterium]|nr:sigma-70 family RNA polymerase sigma factor [Burkholderiaceae bacterium]